MDDLTDAEIIRRVRRWLDAGNEKAEVEMRWLRRVCWLAEQRANTKPRKGVTNGVLSENEPRD